MKKRFFLILLFFLTPPVSNAQPLYHFSFENNVSKLFINDNSGRDVLDKAYMRCMYEFRTIRDTLSDNPNPATTEMVLYIGRGVSRFCSPFMIHIDSMVANNMRNNETTPGLMKLILFIDHSQVYKLHKEKNIIFTDIMVESHFRYEERLEAQEWKIRDEYREILGYACQKAECDFRGRRYTAWFTPEVPVPEGPWKFFGLPGLIVSVADDKGHYSYELTGIELVENAPILFARRSYNKTDRKTYLRTLRRYKENPFAFAGSRDPVENRPNIQFDLIERDYR